MGVDEGEKEEEAFHWSVNLLRAVGAVELITFPSFDGTHIFWVNILVLRFVYFTNQSLIF